MKKETEELVKIIVESHDALELLGSSKGYVHSQKLQDLYEGSTPSEVNAKLTVLQQAGLVEKNEDSTGYKMLGKGRIALEALETLERISK